MATTRTVRPALHVTAPHGWINDPHGVTFHDGLYHAFYQYVPDGTEWRPWCHWGHATSPDLVTWTHRPIALTPGDGDLGCWSGGLAYSPDDGIGTIFYTAVSDPDLDLGTIRSARPADDRWDHWEKGGVRLSPPESQDLRVFRDPSVFRDGEVWRMIVGAGHRDGRGAVLSYVSDDLERWRFDGTVAERLAAPADDVWTGTAWECPQLIAVGDRHVLLVSVWDDNTTHYIAAAVGSYANGRMRVDHWTRLTYGGSCGVDTGHYAVTAFADRDGRPCLMGWIRQVGGPNEGWAGALSIPYLLSLRDDHVLLSPHPDVRGSSHLDPRQALGLDWGTSDAPPDGMLRLPTTDGDPLVVLTAHDGVLDVETSSTRETLPLGPGTVSVVLDGSILEVCTGTALVGLRVDAAGDLGRPDRSDAVPWWSWTA